MKMEKHELEEPVSSAKTKEGGTRLALEKERAALSDAEKALSNLKTEKHGLEERMSSVESDQGGILIPELISLTTFKE